MQIPMMMSTVEEAGGKKAQNKNKKHITNEGVMKIVPILKAAIQGLKPVQGREKPFVCPDVTRGHIERCAIAFGNLNYESWQPINNNAFPFSPVE